MRPFIRETWPVGLLGCNCTLLGDPATGEAIVIDPGLAEGGCPLHLMKRLQGLGLKLRQIVITHAHIDHVGGALILKQATGAPIFMHGADLPLLEMMPLQAGWLGIEPPPVAAPDELLKDGLRIGLEGLSGEVLHTPGHTEGSVCLHFPEQRLLFAGDTLFHNSIGRTDLPGGDSRKILRSIENRLLPLPESTVVVPGHGEETKLGIERERNPFLQQLL